MTLDLLKSIAEPGKVPCLDKYIELKVLDSGKTKEEVKESNKERMASELEKNGGVKSPSYLELFQSNKTIEEISQIKNVKTGTVESNIVDLYIKGHITSIDNMINEKYVQDILKMIKDPEWNGRLKPIKENLPEDCTYGCIRAVIAKESKEGFTKKKGLDSLVASAAARVNESKGNTINRTEHEMGK